FKHDALPDAANHIRLLEVLDDNYSETIKIRCRMATWPVDAMPSYHAISYTWGDLESNITILINDKTFRVRMNCEFALKQAYWYGKSCYYWVDAVCIDQGNLEEKGKQVAMMGMIYKSADHVLACVGDHADDS
ncbi:heterokaryon incompatibility protein-domain-containing protein, partial [Diaporthe sp. PMI_573]